MAPSPIKHIVIAGGGTAGWMVAASLIQTYKATIKITLIESKQIGTIGVGEATIPTIRRFYKALGFSDLQVMKQTNATCKLGIQFENWNTEDSTYFHPFGVFGEPVNNIPFHHLWLRAKKLGLSGNIEEFSFAVQMALKHRFFPPDGHAQPGLGAFDWALHLDASLFVNLLKNFATNMGVHHIDGVIDSVELHPDTGNINSLKLNDGHNLPGDLFIDCTGINAKLIGEALKVPYCDWSHWLLCDRAIAAQFEGTSNFPPYTKSTAHSAGWIWSIPLQNRIGSGLVYSSNHISDDEGVNALMQYQDQRVVSEPKIIKFTPGRRQAAWQKNCIAVGLSAGFLEPLESTSIALIETAIEKIKLLLPDQSMNTDVIDEFNNMTRLEYERVRDFIILHYWSSQRNSSQFWRDSRAVSIPPELSKKISLYQARGHLVKYRWEIFQEPSWIALYSGNQIFPESFDPATLAISDDEILRALHAMKNAIAQGVSKVPLHNDFLTKYFHH